VYAGNLPGRVGSLENTHCPRCNELIIERKGYSVRLNDRFAEGICPKCKGAIAGVWQ
jgi:pyruvate formate lyase activating enzyme